MDDYDTKYRVLELLCSTNQAKRWMCELRMALFVAGANSTRVKDCVLPFPACFFDPNKNKENQKQTEELRNHISNIPKLSELNLESELPELTWTLLYWVFTNPLNIHPLVEDVVAITEKWRLETGLDFPVIDNTFSFIFKVQNPYPKKAFTDGKAVHGSFFAFHGSSLDNFHSIIHRGLISALNKRSAYGVGSYLTNSFKTSEYYSGDLNSVAWENSVFGIYLKCVAICEVVKNPKIPQENLEDNITYFVVANDDIIQLSYILLFSAGGCNDKRKLENDSDSDNSKRVLLDYIKSKAQS